MVPIYSTTFTRSLKLPRHRGARVKVSQRMFERHAFNALLREYIKDRKHKYEHKMKEKMMESDTLCISNNLHRVTV